MLKILGNVFMKVFKKIFIFTKRAIEFVIKAFINLVYPPYCILCDSWLGNESSIICHACWERLKHQCLPFNLSPADYQSFSRRLFFDKAIACWDFNPELQQIIHSFKYQGMRSLSEYLGSVMAQAVVQDEQYRIADLIIPVPLYSARKRERGYNQSFLLGKKVSELTGIRLEPKLLRRVKDTKTQTKLNIHQRTVNVSQAFRVKNPEIISGKSIILIDDVITTGATLNACAQELKAEGAKKVLVLAIAKA